VKNENGAIARAGRQPAGAVAPFFEKAEDMQKRMKSNLPDFILF
jgi:hypothetical protein